MYFALEPYEVALFVVVQFLIGLLIETRISNSIKHEYDKKLEEIKYDIKKREQAADIATALTEWISEPIDYKKLNEAVWRSTLWLPDNIAIELNKLLSHNKEAKTTKQLLVEVKKLINGGKTELTPEIIVHFKKNG